MNYDKYSIRFFIILICILELCCISIIAETTESDSEQAYIDLTVSSSAVEIGDTFIIEGYIVPSLLTRPGDKILLQVTSPKESRADTYYQIRVGADGIFNLELSADAMGDWSFVSRYESYSSDVVPLTVTGRAKVKETELTISGPYSILHVGDKARLSGWLNDIDGNGVPYRQVWYSFGLPSYSCVLCDDDGRRIWQTLGPVTTDEIGYFEFAFDIREKGTYAVKASFPGDEIYAAIESETHYPQVF